MHFCYSFLFIARWQTGLRTLVVQFVTRAKLRLYQEHGNVVTDLN